jgi:outer membrane protein OmpA-like peptidoglycan-associated protein
MLKNNYNKKLKLSVALLLGAIFSSPAFAQNISFGAEGVHINDGNSNISFGAEGVHISDGKSAVVSTPSALRINSKKTTASYVNGELHNMSFEGKNLSGVAFNNAKLISINFRNSDLRDASFTNAEINNCDFRGALVSGASFTNAVFTGSKIGGVDFSSANITNANMTGADFTTDVAVSAKTIQSSLTDAKTAKINLAINFDFDKDTLQQQGLQQLAELGMALKSTVLAGAHIRIEGHTDAKGTDEYNNDLSYRRAARIMRALTEQYGIASDLLEIKGYGKSKPIADNSTEFGRAQNRRVTIVNTSIKQ